MIGVRDGRKQEANVSGHFKPLDGFRALAIAWVVLIHSFDYSGDSFAGRAMLGVARAGWAGVPLFFTLSGFLISLILLDTRGRPGYYRDFYCRRVLRILPLYIAFLTLYLHVLPRIEAARLLPQLRPGEAWVCWTFLTNMRMLLIDAPNVIPPPLQPLWSLAVEEQVYLLWPALFAAFSPRRLPAVLLAIAVTSAAFRAATQWFGWPASAAFFPAIANLEHFAAGGLVAWGLRHDPTRLVVWANRLLPVAAAAVAVVWACHGHFFFFTSPWVMTVGVSALAWTFAAAIGVSVTGSEFSWLNRVLTPPWLCWVGRRSFAIYLVHETFVIAFRPLIGGSGLLRAFALPIIVFTAAAMTAFATWHLIEQPSLRLKKYFPLHGRPPRPIASTGCPAESTPRLAA